MAQELEATLRGLGKDVEIVVHDGVDHAFFNDARPEVYDADAVGGGLGPHAGALPQQSLTAAAWLALRRSRLLP